MRALTIAASAAVLCLCAGRVVAQPLVATATTVGDTCADPAQGGCSRGILHVVNGVTLGIQSSMNLWQGVPRAPVLRLGESIINFQLSGIGFQCYRPAPIRT